MRVKTLQGKAPSSHSLPWAAALQSPCEPETHSAISRIVPWAHQPREPSLQWTQAQGALSLGGSVVCKSLGHCWWLLDKLPTLHSAQGRGSSHQSSPKLCRLQKYGESSTVTSLVHRHSYICHLWFTGGLVSLGLLTKGEPSVWKPLC